MGTEASAPLSALDRFVWSEEGLVLDDLVFRTNEHSRRSSRDHFDLFKSKPMLDQFARLLKQTKMQASNVVELGIWDGGSTALWFEVLHPKKLVALDLDLRGDSEYFRWYVGSRGLDERLHTYWGTDQADADRLRSVVASEFAGPLDLVIDDASHLYEPTKSSFETLFPLLRPGGLYIIEDWPWEHSKDFQGPDHPWADEESLTKLVIQLVEAAGSHALGTIGSLTVLSGFVAIERGWRIFEDPATFSLDDSIIRRSGG